MKQAKLPSVKSATRAIDVLEHVARADAPPTFAQIGQALNIPNSSLFYLLNTLTTRSYLRQDGPKGSYHLGPALMSLASSASRISWSQMVQPLVEQVWSALRETTSYFEPRGTEMECLICKLGQHSLIPVHRVGQRSPMYVFSGGKVVLSELAEPKLDEYLDKTELKAFTKYTLTTPDGIRSEIAKVRLDGCAISREEHSLGTIGISVPLRTQAGLIGTLGVAIPAVRFDAGVLEHAKGVLQTAAGTLMGPQGG